MDGTLKASLITSVSVFVIAAVFLAVQFPASGVAQAAGSDNLEVTFEEYPSLDHVCFIIEAFNAAGTDASFSPRFILNQTSIDVEKASTKLYREREHMYTVTSCNECVAESCAEDNVTGETSCQTMMVEDCSLCGSTESQKTDTVWEDAGPASAEITGAHGEEELKSTFSEVAVPVGGNEKYKLCYYFNEIPMNPSTGKPGSYGFMYLDTGEKLYYDFEHSSTWNVSMTYYRTLTQVDAYPDACLAGSRLQSFNGTLTEVWVECTAAREEYNNESGKDVYGMKAGATVGTDLVNTTFPDTGNPWDSSALYILHLNGSDIHNSAAGTYPHGVTRGSPMAEYIGNGINLNGNIQDILLDKLFNSDFAVLPQTGTFMFWFKPNTDYPKSFGNYYERMMIDKTDNSGIACFWMTLLDSPDPRAGELKWVVGNTPATYLYSNISSWQAGTWYHIVLTWGNETGEAMYVNGVLEASNTTAHAYACGIANNSARGLHIGINYVDTLNINAAFDEIRVYNRTLNATEINSTYWSQIMTFSFSALGPQNVDQSANEDQGRSEIVGGIRVEFPEEDEAPIETDQKIHVRYANDTQISGTFDKTVTYGNQTWVFNYLTGGGDNPYAGMLNITTVFYGWEKTNMTVGSIQTAVAGLIGLTKSS